MDGDVATASPIVNQIFSPADGCRRVDIKLQIGQSPAER